MSCVGVVHTHTGHGHTSLSDQDLISASSWRQLLGGGSIVYCLMTRDERGSWVYWPYVCRGADYRGGADTISPSRLVT